MTALLGASCRPAEPALAGPAPQPENGKPVPSDCPITVPGAPTFFPPGPWPSEYPYAGSVWYGTPDLWTALPVDGRWAQLALGEKSWWWSTGFDAQRDPTPDLVVTARRLDGEAGEFRSKEASNGYHSDFHWAMLTGVDLPSGGCWEITGSYAISTLRFVVWVP